MSKELGTYELIQNYLNGKLSKDALKAFEVRMSSEQDFNNYVEDHRVANQVIKRNELLGIKKELQRIHDAESSSGESWKLITMICVAIGLSIFSWNYFDNESDVVSVNQVEENAVFERSNNEKNNNKIISTTAVEGNETASENNLQLKEKNQLKADVNSVLSDEEKTRKISDSISQLSLKTISTESLSDNRLPDLLKPPSDEVKRLTKATDDGVKVNCEPYEVELDLSATPSCKGSKDGTVEIENTFLTEIYKFKVDNSISQSSKKFYNLNVGKHEVCVVDKKGCSSNPISVVVEEFSCDIILQPQQNIYWNIPLEISKEESVLLEIFNVKSGVLVYSNELMPYEQNVWEGRDSNGQVLSMGAYKYIFRFVGHQLSGDITILQ